MNSHNGGDRICRFGDARGGGAKTSSHEAWDASGELLMLTAPDRLEDSFPLQKAFKKDTKSFNKSTKKRDLTKKAYQSTLS